MFAMSIIDNKTKGVASVDNFIIVIFEETLIKQIKKITLIGL